MIEHALSYEGRMLSAHAFKTKANIAAPKVSGI
jgi:hypothetical protein